MIKKTTNVTVKDNSGVLAGRCIDTYKKPAVTYGDLFAVAVTKAKFKTASKKSGPKTKKAQIQALLAIQTRKQYIRLDGGTLKFNANVGVCVTKSGTKPQLGFKRINTSVPFELKKHTLTLPFGNNLIKLAKNLV